MSLTQKQLDNWRVLLADFFGEENAMLYTDQQIELLRGYFQEQAEELDKKLQKEELEKTMNCEDYKKQILEWMINYAKAANKEGWVIGVSGGVDSGLVSTLCALTGMSTIAVSMPIHQETEQFRRATEHLLWLQQNFKNVKIETIDLTKAFDELIVSIPKEYVTELSSANTRSRVRMATLMDIACAKNMLVAGTGNKVEDFGVGFFTKFGDGGVDLCPIGDLLKSEVRELAKHLGVSEQIYNAIPTDGLWGDNRSDEQQIGATYEELEWAMKYIEDSTHDAVDAIYETAWNNQIVLDFDDITDRQKEVLRIYAKRHVSSEHKLQMPPVCKLWGTEE